MGKITIPTPGQPVNKETGLGVVSLPVFVDAFWTKLDRYGPLVNVTH